MIMHIRANIEPLYWESQFFGVSSAILRCDNNAPILTECKLASWKHIQTKVPAWKIEDLYVFQNFGFQLVEGEIDFAITVKRYENNGAEIAEKADIPILRQMAKSLFSKSRFCAPWYESDASSRFYAHWIESAVLGAFDNICLIFRNTDGEIHGFVSLRYLNDTEARIGLLAGHGIGKKLIQAALHWSYWQNLKTLYVSTQIGNIAAIKCYIASGATISATSYWLYR